MEKEWFNRCQSYIGKSQHSVDALSPDRANALLATLDEQPVLARGDALPWLFHWLYFQALLPHGDLKADGHQKMGMFLPPIPLPRRMWAGSIVQFIKPLRLGAKTERVSQITDVTLKTGASGLLCFVTVAHNIHQDGALCLVDKHQIVYREANQEPMPRLETEGQGAYCVDAITLFRYSALTFNAHRIHYDHDYVRKVENYPSLVVHGPLMATMMMRHAQKAMPHHSAASFVFKALAPVFENEPFDIALTTQGKNTELKLVKPSGIEALRANITWSKSG